MTSLDSLSVSIFQQRKGEITSVTPNSLTTCFPCSVPSLTSICWNTRLSVWGLKSAKLGRAHCWSFSELFFRKPAISCVIFSSTSDSKWLGWLEPIFPFGPFWELLNRFAGSDIGSSFLFLVDAGEEAIFCRALLASPRNLFWGTLVGAMMIVWGVEEGWRRNWRRGDVNTKSSKACLTWRFLAFYRVALCLTRFNLNSRGR